MGMTLETVILECRDIERLAGFYGQLLGWPVVFREEGFIRLQPPEGGTGIALQYAPDYLPPVWPSEAGAQQMMAHLDFGIRRSGLRTVLKKALSLGAVRAKAQYGGDEWVTLLDPAGHPFCILIWD